MMTLSQGQMALLTFCSCIGLASVGLVLTITVLNICKNCIEAFSITEDCFPLKSSSSSVPYFERMEIMCEYAEPFIWKRGTGKELIKVSMIVAEDWTLSEIVVQGDDQQVEQMRKELQLSKKGMVYLIGIFKR